VLVNLRKEAEFTGTIELQELTKGEGGGDCREAATLLITINPVFVLSSRPWRNRGE